MRLIDKAIEIAREAHRGQLDKVGADYIGHPLRVMKMGRNLDERIVGVLHDVVEDSHFTFEDLEKEGFDDKIINALHCVTKLSENEDYDAFIERCATNPLATAVKIHDLSDNLDVRRLYRLTENDISRTNKYLKAYQRLLPLYQQLENNRKKILYIDMDGVLVNFAAGLQALDRETKDKYADRCHEIPGFFRTLPPVENAIESFLKLSKDFDTYILSTAPWNNPTALTDKKEWIKQYLGDVAKKRVIFSHQKNLNYGDYLIDDRLAKGAAEFAGELILFGSDKFPDWAAVVNYLKEKIK